ncbi:MAG: glycosyltransferase family 2 protein [Rhodothermales bacterium]
MTTRTQPLVSVIVPVYNVEGYIDACLESVKGQTYRNLEILLVEDCSTDDSLRALEKHAVDGRVRLLRHAQNAGLSAARNTGIEAARGDYLLFIDSDDFVEPDLVESCVECALDNDADLVLFDFAPFRDGSQVHRQRAHAGASLSEIPARDASFFALPQFAWLKFIRAPLVQERSLRFPVGHYYEDGPFHWELGLHAERVFHLKEPFYHYRQRGTSITGSGGTKLFDQFATQRMIAEALERGGRAPGAAGQLAAKVYRSIWFIANNIADELLSEALSEIREHLQATSGFRQKADLDAKTALLLLLVTLPRPLALGSIRAMRKTVRLVSPARRAVDKRRDSALSSTHVALG